MFPAHITLKEEGEASRDFQRLVADMPDGVLVHRGETILHANTAAALLTGLASQELLLAEPLSALLPSRFLQVYTQFTAALARGETSPASLELSLSGPEGGLQDVEVTANLTTFQGEQAVVMVMRDISRRKQLERRIHHQANFDTLTGLPNRALFMDRLEHELIRAHRQDSRVALMFIDLDRFKWVNDTLGHAAGDQLLKEASRRLLECIRKSDTVARLGGDEFTIILPDMNRGPFAERVAAKILDKLAMAFDLEGQEVYISGSIGVTIFPDDAGDVQGLLKNADSAMYRAKNDGRNAYRFFTPDMHAEALERMTLEKELRYAIPRQQLEIHFQPIIHLESGRLLGAESFLRWRHPERGYVPPNLFVPLAEETGIISVITEWALLAACQQARIWREGIFGSEFFVSVNLTCTRCRDFSTDDKIPGILNKAGLPPSALVLEITENILMENEAKAMAMLHHLKRLGVRLWLDDFGTGYSSLSFLKKLPVHGVKIDRSFVMDLPGDVEAVALVEAVISLAHSLQREVVGEGVETEAQRGFLLDHSCAMGQGYFLGRPMPADEFQKWFEERKGL